GGTQPCTSVDGVYAGENPSAIASDGTNMWVVNANYAEKNVFKLSPTGDALQLTVGTNPVGIAFDATHMSLVEAAAAARSYVAELSRDGAMLGASPFAGGSAQAVAFDGTNMWVVDSNDGTVTELGPDGATVGVYTAGTNPWAIAFDGTNMWVANMGSNDV